MNIFDRMGISLPDLPDEVKKESSGEQKRKQTIKALSESFRESVKSFDTSGDSLETIIQKMSIKTINYILFDLPVPNVSGIFYNSIIEDFLTAPENFKDEMQSIVDGYCSTIDGLRQRVQFLLLNGKTAENDPENKTSTAIYLDTRLTSICERTKLVLSVYSQLQEQLLQMQTAFNNLENKIDNTKATSDSMMPNIVTLLGVFSSIIVVILSLITTSSTWLSNANEASILEAFIVPTGIIILAVCALTAFVRSLLEGQSQSFGTQAKSQKELIMRTLSKWSLWLVISIVTSVVVCITIMFCQDKSSNQTHYLTKYLPISELFDNGEDEEINTTLDVPETFFIVQTVILPTGEEYPKKIPCSEGDKHEDGFVYYCLLHQAFE